MRLSLFVLLLFGCSDPADGSDAGAADAGTLDSEVAIDATADAPIDTAPDTPGDATIEPDVPVVEEVVFPAESWDEAAPEDFGLSTDRLRAASDGVGRIGGRQCFVVIHDGYLVFEDYYRGDAETKNAAWSVTKSLGAAALGVAIGQGLLSVNDRVDDWVDTPWTMHDDATLRHVLGQVSEADPAGTNFSYDSGAVVNTLAGAMGSAAGMGSGEFARTHLLEPTGMDRGIDWAGSNVRFGEGSFGTCRGFARLGWLMANRGNWDGEQLIPVEYVDAATSPSFPEINEGYGYLWWLNGRGHWERPLGIEGDGPMIPEAPDTMYFATGLFSQFIFVMPETNTIVVTMGQAFTESIATARDMWRVFGPAIE